MNIPDKITFKKNLVQHCIALLRQRAQTAEEAMKAAQEAANNEEKSSAGDKYETSRAMSQLDRDMNARQLDQVLKELKLLEQINPEQILNQAAMGSVITGKEMLFFIAVGLGKISFENHEIVVLSPQAPLTKSLLGKKAGEDFIFNKQQIRIEEVF